MSTISKTGSKPASAVRSTSAQSQKAVPKSTGSVGFKRDELSTGRGGALRANAQKYLGSAGVSAAVSVRPPPPPRSAATAIREARALFVNPDTSGKPGAIGGTVTDYRSVNDASIADAAKTQLEKNRPLEEKALAALPKEDQQRYRDVQTKLDADPAAKLAMQTMLIEGRLPGEKDLRDGKTLLQQLDGLSKQTFAPELQGSDKLLAQTVKEVFIPASIGQGGKRTCGPTSALAALANANPAEYVRLVSGLASPSGSVVMANGDALVREPGTLSDDGVDRSVSKRLLGPAAMEYANGILGYDNGSDTSARFFGGLTAGMEEHLLEGLFGRDFKTSEDMSAFMAGMLPHGMKGLLAEQALAAVDEGKSPVAVQMNWPTGNDSHFLVIDHVERTNEGTFVVLRNPWGQEERVPYDAFKDHLTGVVQPSK